MTSPAFLRSAAIRAALAQVRAHIDTDCAFVLCGEAGTGREAIARAIHRASVERDPSAFEHLFDGALNRGTGDRFVVVDCAAEDAEAMLFGCADTASSDGLERVHERSGLALAASGTLCLRHVHEMPVRMQLRLARVLRDREVWVDEADGRGRLQQVRTRLIALADSTPDRAADDRLTPELARRLSIRVEIPPLRERREDIAGLVRELFSEQCTSMRLPAKAASKQAVALLSALPWRGNINEMRAVIGTLVVKVRGRLVRLEDVLAHVPLDGAATSLTARGTLREAREQFEREYVSAVLQQHHGRMGDAARTLGIQRTNLYRKVRQLAVERRPSRD